MFVASLKDYHIFMSRSLGVSNRVFGYWGIIWVLGYHVKILGVSLDQLQF